jgi:hypothetical protein
VKSFTFTFQCTVTLDETQIWPDMDGPEDPTANDVLAVIDDCGGAREVLRDWSLDDGTTTCVVVEAEPKESAR